jgi:hypothetical protein
MKKKYLIWGVAAGLLLAYLIIINFAANILSNPESSAGQEVRRYDNGDIVVGVSDSVAVSVVRPRWYGTIYEESWATTKLARLYLFGFIPIPVNVNGSGLFFVHLIFIAAIAAAIGYAKKRIKRYYYERGYF